MDTKSLDWANFDFSYKAAALRFHSRWKDGSWDNGKLVKDNYIKIEESATCIHYGQQCFEGMKANRSKDGRILLFRPEENAKRIQDSSKRLMMPPVPTELFMKGINETIKANIDYVPPYGFGASLYIRPMVIGVGHNLGVKPARNYLFVVFVVPVGPYFKEGFKPIKIKTEEYFDRAAPHGIGNIKAGSNYSAALLPDTRAKEEGFDGVVYLDAQEHKYFEELGAANIFFILKDNTFATPKSDAILPSIIRRSIVHIAQHDYAMNIEERAFKIDEVDNVAEAGACGTAAVITPIGQISINGKLHKFFSNGEKPGPVTEKLYRHLTSIQTGDKEDKYNWIQEVK